MIAYCQKHNIKMLPSKFGEGKFWCPKCAEERKKNQQPQKFEKAVSPIKITLSEVLRDLNDNIKRIEKKIDSLLNVSVIYPKDLKEPRPSEEIEEEL